MARNHEVTEKHLLLDAQGELVEPGWSRRLVQTYERKMIKAPKWRIKEWDYYLVMGQGFAGAFTISDDGYIGLQSVSLHKLDDVEFHIPENIMDTWTFTSSDGRFEMEFTPVLDRAANIDFKVLVSDQHQVFGKMTGKAVLDDGTMIEVKDMMCFAERVHNKY